MFGFGKRKKPVEDASTTETAADSTADDLASRLAKTRRGLGDSMADFFLGRKTLDQNTLDDLETSLLSADVGVEATSEIIDDLQARLSRKALDNEDALQLALSDHMFEILHPCEQELEVDTAKKPFVILVVGINGAGKTTSIGKLAHYFQKQGKSVMLAAGDTFRAAAVEQLKEWGARNNVPVVAQATGADAASVIFDAVQSGQSKQTDVVIADTAGRLHTQSNLMDELAKIKRVMAKLDPESPHETLLIMDAGFGQNALQQAEQFHKALGLTGLAVTKLDGTARGGILFAIAGKLGIPIRFIGVGEGIEDLRPFHAREFVSALLQD
jgi:fused signal recognition particle receptor